MKDLLLISLLLIFINIDIIFCSRKSILLSTSRGSIRGNVVDEAQSQFSYEFLGIPYAQAPIQELRFKPPIPHSDVTWSKIFEATELKPTCYRRVTNSSTPFRSHLLAQDENCLHLNIYTPTVNSSSMLPVLVWFDDVYNDNIHPSWKSNRNLVREEEIIVVTFSYRRGIFGFLPAITKQSNTKNQLIHNLALLDQQAAINWIVQHIGDFGGNPNRITLGGHGVDSVMVSLHLLSPNSRGLFQQCLIQSGTPVNEFSYRYMQKEDMHKIVFHLANLTSISYEKKSVLDTMEMIIDHFQNMTSESLLYLEELLKNENPRLQFLPVVDGHSIPDKPEILIKQGRFYKANIMIGLAQSNYDIKNIINSTPSKNQNDPNLFNQQLLNHFRSQPHLHLYHQLVQLYEHSSSNEKQQPMQIAMTYLHTDTNFLLPAVFCANHFTEFGLSLYFYALDHFLGDDSSKTTVAISIPLEVIYLFGNSADNFKNMKHQYNASISHQVTQLWSQFFRSG